MSAVIHSCSIIHPSHIAGEPRLVKKAASAFSPSQYPPWSSQILWSGSQSLNSARTLSRKGNAPPFGTTRRFVWPMAGLAAQEGSPTSIVSSSNAGIRMDGIPVEGEAVPSVSLGGRQVTLPPLAAPKRVVLVRHGESTWNATGRIQGSSDFSELTAKGESQAETSRQMLMGDNFDACFHSPLKRSAKTAEIIWGARTKPMTPLWDLREIDLYSFQGLLKEEGQAKYGPAYSMWQRDAARFEIDGHRPVQELWDRALECWREILSCPAQSVLVVAHNAVNQALVATATGLGPEYFRQLLQSNCGVSVLDFFPRGSAEGPPHVRLNRLNQTPSPPVAGGGGRKAKTRLLLVCHGATDSSANNKFSFSENEPLNMLGIIQSNKTAELLLDVEVHSILSSPFPRAKKTAEAICQVQEAADCLGVDCRPRYCQLIEFPELRDLDWGAWEGKFMSEVQTHDRWEDQLQHMAAPGGEPLDSLWERAGESWQSILQHLARPDSSLEEDRAEGESSAAAGEVPSGGRTVVVVAHELVHAAMLAHCLRLSQSWLGSVRLDDGSLSVVDFPDGPEGRGVVRCLNYTAHLGRWAVPVTRPSLADEDF